MEKCRKIHATRSGPSGLGMMQTEPPQQGKLKDMSKRDTCRRDGPSGLGITQPKGRSQLKRAWKMSPGSVDEEELVQMKACIEEMTPHEPPEP